MKDQIQQMLNDVVSQTEFRQAWDKDHPEAVDEGRRAKLHFLDGKREALEEVLKVAIQAETPREVAPLTLDEIDAQIENRERRIRHHEQRKEEAQTKKAHHLAGVLRGYKLKPGEDPDNWPIMETFNNTIAGHERVIEDLTMDLKLLKEMRKETRKMPDESAASLLASRGG